MKKASFLCYTALFGSMFLAAQVYSQRSAAAVESLSVKNNWNPDQSHGTKAISQKAIKNFNNVHQDIPNVNWFISSAGLSVAHFVLDSVETFIYYSNRGTYEFMVRNYKENKLLTEVRHLIKSNYYDFAIYHVTEISRNGKIAYCVNLNNNGYWKTVKVVDGEIELITEYTEPRR